jgi:leader peptidase (prepilin peptidase)/N-methyltransferase
LGLLAGWPAIVMVIVIAIILAGIISLIAVASMLIRRDYQADFAIPYGPFLVSGAILVIYFGNLLRSILAT